MTVTSERPSTLRGLLRTNPNYRRLYIGQVVSQGGDWFAMIPLVVLLQQLTGSPFLGAVVLAADTLVIALFSPLAAAITDRFDRRLILVYADLASAMSVSLLLFVQSENTAWIAIVAYAGLAASKAFFAPTANAMVPSVVKSRDLLTASSGLGALWGIMLAVGASFGPIVSSLTGPYICFALNAVSFLVSAWLLSRLQPGPRLDEGPAAPKTRISGWASLTSMLSLNSIDVRYPLFLLAKPGTGIGNGIIAVFPAFVVLLYGGSGVATGFLYAGRGIGAMIGPLVGRVLLRAGFSCELVIGLSIGLFGVSYLLFSESSFYLLALALVVLAHVGGSMNSAASTFALQDIGRPDMLGRLFSADNLAHTLALGMSQVLAAVLARSLSGEAIIQVLAWIVLGYGLVWSLNAVRNTRRVYAPT